LKHAAFALIGAIGAVAPRAGAWIETIGSSEMPAAAARSRPVRARGLKRNMTFCT